MAQATKTCGHPSAQYLCRRCQTEFCPDCLEDHARFLGQLSEKFAARLGTRLSEPLPTWDDRNHAFCPRCAAEFSQMQSVGRTIDASMHEEEFYDEPPGKLTLGQYLAICAQRDLLPHDLVTSLRRESGKYIQSNDPRALARWLVKHHHLSAYQAQQVLRSEPLLPGLKAEPAAATAQAAAAPAKTEAPRKPSAKTEPAADLWQDLPELGSSVPSLDELSDLSSQQPVGLAPVLPGAKRPAKKLLPSNVWDSKLVLLGGGGLLAMLILAGVLVWSILRGSGDDAFRKADTAYENGSYTQAIALYDAYLKSYPTHKDASLARVRRGLAEIRQTVDGTKDFARALDICKTVIEKIRQEERFLDARAELSAVLPKVADGLASQALEKLDDALAEKAREALALVKNSNYVQKKYINEQVVRDAETKLGQVEHNLNRNRALAAAILEINAAIQRKDTAQVYARRKELLKQYPELFNDKQLETAVRSATETEQSTVAFKTLDVPAETTDHATAVQGSVPLASPTGGTAPGVEGRVVTALAEGAAYGLDAASGKVLWRRFVGFDSPSPPIPVARVPGSDVLVVDASHSELVRLGAQKGELKWRQRVSGGVGAAPVVLRQRVLVPTADARLVAINLEDGRLTGEVRFSQNVRSLAVDRDEKQAYVVGHHTNLYVLDLAAAACRKVVYLGHEPGSVRAAPLLIDTYLVVAENIGTKFSRFLVLGLEEGGAAAKIVQVTEPPLDGQIQLPPLVQGRQVVATTDLGAVYVFDISPGGEKPLSQTQVSAPRPTAAPVEPFPLVRGSQLWIADKQLVRYDIQLNTGRLVPRWAKDTGDTFLQPLESSGEILFHARRRSGVHGVSVSAVRLEDGERLWEIHLAAPAATGAIVDPSGATVSALTAAGGLYRLSAADLQRQTAPAGPHFALPVDSPDLGLLQDESAAVRRLGSAALVAWPRAPAALLVDPRQEGEGSLRWIALPGKAGCAPLLFQGRLLVPGAIGQVFWLDVAAGREAAQPFQPAITGKKPFAWLDADGSPDDDPPDDLVLGDGDKSLYRIGLRSLPVDHLAALDKADLADALVSSIGRVGGWAYAVDDKQRLVAFELPALAPSFVPLPSDKPQLAGWPAWGPRRVGQHVLLVTDDGLLYCLGADGKLAWHAELADGPLAGGPLASGGQFVLISLSGAVATVDAATGRALGKIDVGQPLAPGAALLGDRLVLPGHDGTLHLAPMPASSMPGKTPAVASR